MMRFPRSSINNHSSKSGDKQRGSSSSKPTTAKFPSGLVPNWQTKVSKASHATTRDRQPARSPLGGLVDNDAHAERPDIADDAADHKHKSRKNEVGFYFDLHKLC